MLILRTRAVQGGGVAVSESASQPLLHGRSNSVAAVAVSAAFTLLVLPPPSVGDWPRLITLLLRRLALVLALRLYLGPSHRLLVALDTPADAPKPCGRSQAAALSALGRAPLHATRPIKQSAAYFPHGFPAHHKTRRTYSAGWRCCGLNC